MTDKPTDAVAQVRNYTRTLTGKEPCVVCGLYPALYEDTPCPDNRTGCLVQHRKLVACPVCQRIAAVRAECAADTKRLDWMQERYVAADFDYMIDEKPATALIIHAPRSARVGPNLRATIDAALEAP